MPCRTGLDFGIIQKEYSAGRGEHCPPAERSGSRKVPGSMTSIDPADCVAVGDGDNDVAMLKAAGLGIAMGSGSAAAKAAADRIGPDAEPHGIAELCRALWPEAF